MAAAIAPRVGQVDPGVGQIGVIAIDGPSGSGKSTTARRLAIRFGVAYLDTGAMYRAATWAVLQAGIDPGDASGVAEVVEASELEIDIDPTAPRCRMNGIDVSVAIRGSEVTGAVSAVAAIAQVRHLLVAQQQAIIATELRGDAQLGCRFDKHGIVVEGRDIASAVVPDAVLKVYLTASQSARAARRHGDTTVPSASATPNGVGGSDVQLVRVAEDLQRRDAADHARAVDPLRVAPGAVVLDTTDLDIDDVVTKLVELHAAAVVTASRTAGKN